MRLTLTSDLWWKNAVIYCLDVETYKDGDGDGVGDFRGLTQQIDHLRGMGVTCVWLMPFFPTPNRDDGYDIADFYAIDPRLGTFGEFVEFVRTARDRGLRVIADLVVNHTSDRHPWFLDARSSRDSRYRDWYVWSDRPEPDDPDAVVFPDEENSFWEWDEKTGQYYLHSFYKHQPDLNVANPEVRDEITRILGFWMELGLSGFRMDAVPFLVENIRGKVPDQSKFLGDLRAFMNRRDGGAVLLGEVNLPYDDLLHYFGGGNGDRLTMCFDFIGMQNVYLSMARGDAGPLAKALRERPRPPKDCQWASFLRNHDELTLDKLSDAERQEVFDAFGPEKDMQVFGRGLRRRLPSMLGGDPRRIKMAYSLMFSLPGTPVLFYGEEIGLSENLDVKGRTAVRVPMQWGPEQGGGFTTADEPRLRVPMPEGRYGPERVNVSDQRRDPDSLLAWITKLIEYYRECPELAWGEYTVLDAGNDAVFAHRADVDDATVVAVHNLADADAEIVLTLENLDGQVMLTDLFTGDDVEVTEDGKARLSLGPYDCRWLRTTRGGGSPDQAGPQARS
ncbi:alpha-amylase [Microtetraspora sp. NBRC 13810]|uniref:alpha-amylase family protein n=1 Tax=Microtetraspora sp. NBRC 13810 TaxID=3030990 RepID=UPI0024A4E92F|nr:alpha-amylase family protein [Microtetraspora sp. NBRC 13810]GLW11927.1 alpha-amylase [Microtetraspora sp. NBRC 13810]